MPVDVPVPCVADGEVDRDAVVVTVSVEDCEVKVLVDAAPVLLLLGVEAASEDVCWLALL